ncbi:MAG: lipopolysaccharide biosynthesis protein [Alphaproteobacteria bacterium]|nr:lipopolysaccharide biosynthesis protein [Alphaproteobacteria bacterium]
MPEETVSTASPKRDPNVHLRTDHLRQDFAGRSVRGGAVTVAAQIIKVAVQFGVTVILARLLRPEAFGLVAMVAVIVAFLELFKDFGLSAATVQRETVTHEDISALFWVNAGLGVAAGLVMIPLAPLLAWFYREPALVGVTLWLGIGFVLSGLSTQHLAVLRRQMRFTALAMILMWSEIIGMAVAVIAAYAGADYWALVVQRLVWALCIAIGAWVFCPWRPGRPAGLGRVRDLLRFGGHVTGSNLVGTFARNLDQILIGWYWGATPLGLYERAYKILLVPINNLNAPLFSVAMPALSRLVDRPALYRRAYLGTVEKLNMVTMPCAAVLIAVPGPVVRVLFGPQWLAATPIVAWLGVAALYHPIGYTCSWLFMTQDRTAEMLRWGLFGSALNAAFIVGGLPFGPVGVAASLAAGGLAVRMPLLFWMVGRSGPVSRGDLVRSMLPSFAASLMIVGALVLIRHAGLFNVATPLRSFAVAMAVAAAVALACFASIPQSRRALVEFARLPQLLVRRRANA